MASQQQRVPDPDDPRKPDDPGDLGKDSWTGVLKRTFKEFLDDKGTDWAAALTYYSVLALFPAIIAVVSIVSLVGDPQATADALLNIVRSLGPQSAVQTLEGPINQVVGAQNTAGFALVLGLAGALWAASGYVAAFSRASNAVYEVEEGRPFWKLRPFQILITAVNLLLVAVVALALVITGPLAQAVGDAIGLGDTAVTLWSWLKWPVLAFIVSTVISILYWAAPNVQQPKFRWFTMGGFVALVIWIVASVAFGFYVANFGSYNKTYGSLAAVVVFLVWLWITNIAILLGAEFNAELERGRELQAGIPGAEENIQLPPRETKKAKRPNAGKTAGRDRREVDVRDGRSRQRTSGR